MTQNGQCVCARPGLTVTSNDDSSRETAARKPERDRRGKEVKENSAEQERGKKGPPPIST